MFYVRSGSARRFASWGGSTSCAAEDYAELELDPKVELIRSLVPLGLMHVEELLDEEVTALAGERYARKDAATGGRRHGSNPGTVGLAGQHVPIRVPRLRRAAGGEIPLRSYAALHGDRAVNDLLLKRVLYGVSCRNYEAARRGNPGRDRAVGVDGVPGLHPGQRGAAPRVPRARPVRRGRRGHRSGRQDVRRCHDGDRAGDHAVRGETVPGLRGDGHGRTRGC